MSRPSSEIRADILGAGVWQAGQVKLNSGRFSDVKLEMDRLVEHREALQAVMSDVASALFEQDIDGFVPVPNGAVTLVRRSQLIKKPLAIIPDKLGKHEFSFDASWAHTLIRRAGHLAIFDDVVTTGTTPLVVAHEVRKINPDIDLSLVAIWRRDELLAECSDMFLKQTFLVEETIPSWLPVQPLGTTGSSTQ